MANRGKEKETMANDRSNMNSMLPPPIPAAIPLSQLAPPSSIVVALQNHRVRAAGRSGIPDPDVFQSLLSEILGGDFTDSASSDDDDVATSYQLIRTLTTAGLDVLLQEDPFINAEQRVDQADSSLLALQLAIKRTPSVLFKSSPATETQPAEPLLYLWLFAKVFPLLGCTNTEHLTRRILDTLHEIFLAMTRTSVEWRHLRIALGFCKSCTNTIVSTLQHTSPRTLLSTSFSVQLPGPQFILDQYIRKVSPKLDISMCQFRLCGVQSLAQVTIQLFTALYRLHLLSRAIPILRCVEDNIPWMLRGLSKLWESSGIYASISGFRVQTGDIRKCILIALDKATENIPASKAHNSKLRGFYLFSVRCIGECFKRPIEEIDQLAEHALAGILLNLLLTSQQLPWIKGVLREQVLPLAVAIMQDEKWGIVHQDTQVAVLRFVYQLSEDTKVLSLVNSALEKTPPGKWVFQSARLKEKSNQLEETFGGNSTRVGSQKRLKTTPDDDHGQAAKRLSRTVYSLLGRQESEELAGLSLVAAENFQNLNNQDKCLAIRNLGLLCCSLARNLVKSASGKKLCVYCDVDGQKSRTRGYADTHIAEIFRTLEEVHKLSSFQSSRGIRACAMNSLRRILNHTQDLSFLSLEETSLGKWCLNSLQSSQRDLRIAAGRTLPSYVEFDHSQSILQKNTIQIMNFLRSLSESEDSTLQETCILALGQLGRISEQDLAAIIQKLIESLGNANSFIIGAAYNELQLIPPAHDSTARRLLTPFWRNISPGIVNKLQSKPQLVQLVAQYLSMDIAEFVSITSQFTLPYLILWQKQDLVARVAQAAKTDARGICRENVTPILTVLLCQTVANIETTTMSLLEKTVEEFKDVTLGNLIESQILSLTPELLKVAGDTENKEAVYRALDYVALTIYNKQFRQKDGQTNHLKLFFESYVLAICNIFSDSLTDIRGKTSVVEKVRCLKAIEEMIKLATGSVSSALPQICACLQAALEQRTLRTAALNAWAALMTMLPVENIQPLLEPTFSVIVQHWQGFRDNEKSTTHNMVVHLFQNHQNMIRDCAVAIPSIAGIPLLAKFETKLVNWKKDIDITDRLRHLIKSCHHENAAVVEQALVELSVFINRNQEFIHSIASLEPPDPIVAKLIRCLLDIAVASKESREESKARIEQLCLECLGYIGAVDPNRIEAPRLKRDFLMLDFFKNADECVAFVILLLEEHVVKAFRAATDTKAQGFLAYGMQCLLAFLNIEGNALAAHHSDASRSNARARWLGFSQAARNTLTPFVYSKYFLEENNIATASCTYPIFMHKLQHRFWLQNFILDLLGKPYTDNADFIFLQCRSMVRGQDTAISKFLLPFVALHVVAAGTDSDRHNITTEFLTILRSNVNGLVTTNIRECSETIFFVFDYMEKWLRQKKASIQSSKNQQRLHNRRWPDDGDSKTDDTALQRVEGLLDTIPADLIGTRSFECHSYARALLYWEKHIRQTRGHVDEVEMAPLYQKLQDIYTEIDEPDGIEGISVKLQVEDLNQQIIEHRKAGRWTAVQSWYQMVLDEDPGNFDAQTKLMTCLKESGQYDVLLNQIDAMKSNKYTEPSRFIPVALEAAWTARNWDKLESYLLTSQSILEPCFEIQLGRALSALRKKDLIAFSQNISHARKAVAKGFTEAFTGSTQQCHDSMVKLHALSELEQISTKMHELETEPALLASRLSIMGTYSKDKQYILALRRAAFELSRDFKDDSMASAWLNSARLARKGHETRHAFNYVFHAIKLNPSLATVEHSKLLWQEGNHRKAILNLEGAIAKKLLLKPSDAPLPLNDSLVTSSGKSMAQSHMNAKAMLLHARWLDSAGQTQSEEMIEKYLAARAAYQRWEQGHYYLGRYYNKLFEAEKALPSKRQGQKYLSGETAKLICQSYLRALAFGTKYIFQTLPRFLTLWLDLGELVSQNNQNMDESIGKEDFRHHMQKERVRNLKALHQTVSKYACDQLPAWMFFTALPQLMSRIVHKEESVYHYLQQIVVRVISRFPRQSMWSLMAVCKSTARERSNRGGRILSGLKETLKRGRNTDGVDIRTLLAQSTKITEELLGLCLVSIPEKSLNLHLKRDMHFDMSVAPCPLVLPVQAALTVALPGISDTLKNHHPFPPVQPTIESFLDDVEIMTSLQKPRKIKIRGSDGKIYTFLCKPKDDLRKDARLMEFNNMINRFLKKDPDSSRRGLYIRTYYVTPLNEECGLIEWVNNIRPFRDIVLKFYKHRGININPSEAMPVIPKLKQHDQYNKLREELDGACKAKTEAEVYQKEVLEKFPPVFHEWFIDSFSEPSAWFASRLRYTRTAAVISMVGTILGLGDRHGENILFDSANGDTVHVDFNCLFDKGLSFEKPEKVPFRLTHNMADACGVTGYEGVFRKSSEAVLRVLRTNEETLMTVLETFIHDPAVDMIKKSKRAGAAKIPETPESILESINNKLKGFFQGDSVPLSVEGQVGVLLREATRPENLCAMYIGWCPFL